MKINPFKLERYFAHYEFNTEYLLSSSDCEAMSIKELLALEKGADKLFQDHWLGYTESQGAPSLRKEISRIYDHITPEQVLVHSGAEEAIFLFMHAVLEPGDHIIVHWPCYQSLFDVAQSLGCQVSLWKAKEETGWKLNLDDLEKHFTANTKAIVINTPHNPTGYLMDQDTFQELSNLVESRGILLFSDEVYRESEHDPNDRLPAACDIGESCISLGVMSKTYGLAGLRIGWIATRNNKICSDIAHLKDYTTICNSAPSEFLAELALRHREILIQKNLGIIRKNINILDEFFYEQNEFFSWQKPIAGPIAFPKFIKGRIEEFCESLVKDAGVLLLPGSIYDYPGDYFRIGFGRRNFPEALDRLADFLLKTYP